MRPFTRGVLRLIICRLTVICAAFALALIYKEGEVTLFSSVLTQVLIGAIIIMRGPFKFSQNSYRWAEPVVQWVKLADIEQARRFCSTLRTAEVNGLAVNLMLVNIIYWNWGSYWPFWALTAAVIGVTLWLTVYSLLRVAKPT